MRTFILPLSALFALCSAVQMSNPALEWTCDNRPIGTTENGGHVVKVTMPQETFTLGQRFQVQVETVDPDRYHIKHIGIQARDLLDNVWGSWEAQEWSSSQQCGNTGGQMLFNTYNVNLGIVYLSWKVPFEPFAIVVQFYLTVMFDDDTYHTVTTPIVRATEYDPHNDPSEFEQPAVNPAQQEEPETPIEETPAQGNPGENPNDGEEFYSEEARMAEELDNQGPPEEQPSNNEEAPVNNNTPTGDEIDALHDPQSEIAQARLMEEKRQQQIAAEAATAEGEWTREEAEEERRREEEYDWELREMERMRYEEEQRRQEILLWEIKDKEEHDAMMAREQPNEDVIDIKDGSGSSVLTASFVLIGSTVLLCFA